MNEEQTRAEAVAQAEVERCRQRADPEALARALEALGRAKMSAVDVVGAAAALEEAGHLWSRLGHAEQAGSCLLLAASSYRLAANAGDAGRVLAAGRAIKMPTRLAQGFEIEACEQMLANGQGEAAWQGFTRFLDQADALEPPVHTQLLQRRAAAALACGRRSESADDLLSAAKIFLEGARYSEYEACALAAAGVLAEIDNAAAERIVSEVSVRVPTDGSAAARRGLVAGTVATHGGAARLALKRFDEARQGALDARDPLLYLAAAVQASHVAEGLGDLKTAYARLAVAWVTLSDLLGRDDAEKMLRPELIALRDRIGTPRFDRARGAYEAERKKAPNT